MLLHMYIPIPTIIFLLQISILLTLKIECITRTKFQVCITLKHHFRELLLKNSFPSNSTIEEQAQPFPDGHISFIFMVKHFLAFWESSWLVQLSRWRFWVPWLLVRGWPLCLTAFSPIHRGTGLPGVEPHWHDPFPDVGWRCGVHPPAHAGEVSQQEELTWNWVSLLLRGQLWEAQRQIHVYGNDWEQTFSLICVSSQIGGFVTRRMFCSVVVHVCRGMSGKNFTSLLPISH